MTEETAPVRRRVVLTGISSRAWEHPADRGALTALRELRGFDEVLKAISGLWNERAWRLEYLGRAIRVDHRQHPRVHRLFAEAAATLDVAELPELYIEFSPTLNASCVGAARAHEAGRWQRPARDRHGGVPRTGRRVRPGRRPARQRHQAADALRADPPAAGGPRLRPAPLGRRRRLRADPLRRLPAPGTR